MKSAIKRFSKHLKKPGYISGVMRIFIVKRTAPGVYEIALGSKVIWVGRARSHRLALETYLATLV